MDWEELRKVEAELAAVMADLEEKFTTEELRSILDEWEVSPMDSSGKLNPERLVEIIRERIRLKYHWQGKDQPKKYDPGPNMKVVFRDLG